MENIECVYSLWFVTLLLERPSDRLLRTDVTFSFRGFCSRSETTVISYLQVAVNFDAECSVTMSAATQEHKPGLKR